jgi:hypothetical protein
MKGATTMNSWKKNEQGTYESSAQTWNESTMRHESKYTIHHDDFINRYIVTVSLNGKKIQYVLTKTLKGAKRLADEHYDSIPKVKSDFDEAMSNPDSVYGPGAGVSFR